MNNTNYKIASIYLPKKNYTLENAKSFLKKHGYKINKVDDENNYF
jgi:ATP phosphoribosyltransferase